MVIRLKKGFEARVVILGFRKKIVFKFYNKSSSNLWLQEKLGLHYRNSMFRNPIGMHEYLVLKFLEESKMTPKPYFNLFNLLIMSYTGHSLENTNIENIKSLSLQAEEIYEILINKGVRHNDIKASNLTIKNGRLHLIDFTLADSPWFKVSEQGPNVAWGRFGMDDALLDLHKLGVKND